MRTPFLIKLTIVFASICFANANADIVTNGSFESVDVPGTGYTDVANGDVDGWVISETIEFQVSLFDRNDVAAPDGTQFLVFNAGGTSAGASIHQLLDTTVNGIYEVAFFAKANIPSRSSVDARVYDGHGIGTLLESQSATVASLGGGNVETTFQFVATSTGTRLEFVDDSVSTSGSDVFLDHVRVNFVGSAVPEPGTLSLVSVAMLLLVSKRRRLA